MALLPLPTSSHIHGGLYIYLAMLQLSDCHPYFITGQFATLYIQVFGCWHNVRWVLWSLSVERLLFLCCSSPSGVLNFPNSLLVVSFRPFIFRALATCSAASASPSMYFLSSALVPFLVFLLAIKYSFVPWTSRLLFRSS